jgi:hypothetical protein
VDFGSPFFLLAFEDALPAGDRRIPVDELNLHDCLLVTQEKWGSVVCR